ncbi:MULTISPECIES: bifunctional metallophosphatase/5'-nucleotidase [Thermodesulfovibrio]|jgi:2',3'-cyclic-nucleotide 2'-phosphodiesterase (5'-nucleotidase family)|uniref:bifunctional metallophosphatase/5'-nucleotidase n=1 Tax=Thermodesulfovibrio TaxID=28261 RepID=UPI002639039C|nr:5'-nucleotidase C-terminal domain-containing protein [Thermodesulfovibrio sp.]
MKRFVFCVKIIIFILLVYQNVFAEPVEIRILHVNDFHGFAESYRPVGSEKLMGGASYLASVIKKLRGEKPTLLLSAGDMIQGDNWANLTEGKSVIELMNAIGFDAMVVGNHEFDFGKETLKKRIAEANFPVLGANVNGLELLKPFLVKELSGVKIAIIGVVTEETVTATHPKNVAGLRFEPVDRTIESILKQVQEKVDLIVVVSHLGFYADRLLAEKVKGINLIVGGHSHTKIEKPVVIGNTIIVQAWEHGKALGVLDLTVDRKKIEKFSGHLIEIVPESFTEDKDISTIVNRYNEMVNSILDERIGLATNDLDGEHVRKKETNLGNFIADVIREKTGADVAIINGGGIRKGIKKGEIKVKDIYSVLPFNNYLVAIKMSGKHIIEALEHGVSAIEEGAGRFPQISGMRFVYDSKAKSGKRILSVYVGDKPLYIDREYTVATNDFLAAGGDGYRTFGEVLKSSKNFEITGGTIISDRIIYSDTSKYLRDVVVDYIKNKKIIAPAVEGRITEVSEK